MDPAEVPEEAVEGQALCLWRWLSQPVGERAVVLTAASTEAQGLPSSTALVFHERVLQGFDRSNVSASSRSTVFRLSSSLIRNQWNPVSISTSEKFHFKHQESVNICHCPVSHKTNSSVSVSSACVGEKWTAAASDLSISSWQVAHLASPVTLKRLHKLQHIPYKNKSCTTLRKITRI